MKNQKIEKRPVDILIDRYAEFHKKPANRYINYICVPLISFSILGFVWSIPFPHLNFLGSYNGYLNWGSFLIALVIYFYMKLSPIISYIMLIVLFVFTFCIIQLEGWQKTGGPILPQMCVVVFVTANIIQFIGYRIEGKKPTSAENFKFLGIEPIWLLSLVLKRFGVKY
ncbi:DUF962 domain-containing protein [Mucilaginibacter sp.]|uniref:Mpo1 family 2-hydroxy fatty acid dioxygenase n=1 Tax=Mucilaginibacter sp. TaxID=1882438 RepID=UPI0026032441|nr:Mpo1-like protein [Mucilaginibacter sp.]MDB4924950.1 hypothetical protein [Mucilaginibacter sp.]